MDKRSILKLLSCVLFWFSSVAFAVNPDDLLPPDQAFQLTTKVKDSDKLVLSWEIAKGYSLYRNKFNIVSLTPNIQVKKPSFPVGHIKQDKFFGEVEILRDHLEVVIPFQRLDSTLNELVLDVTYQGCADIGFCYMPIQKSISFDLSDDSPKWWGIAPTTDHVQPYLSEQDRIAASLKTNSFWLTTLSFLGFGILLAFTPCIFPMLPILTGIVAGQGSNLNTRKSFWLSLSFVLASALTYTVFGILAGLFGSNLQIMFQEPWVIISLSGVFVLLAFSMFDVFQFQIPSLIQTRIMSISSKQQGGSLMGAAIMGILSALAIGPCITAPLTGALIYIGQTGDAVLGGMALFALGLGMGIPMLIIGTYAGKLLPKAGSWLNVTKAIFGMGLLAVAVWLLGRIMTITATLTLWMLLVSFPVLFLIWKKRWQPVSMLALAYGLLLWVGISTNQFNALQPLLCNVSVACEKQPSLSFQKIGSVQELRQSLVKAHAHNQWVMLDYYADWCTACTEMALYTFSDPTVQAALSQVVLLQADVTHNSPSDQALLRQFKLMGPPAILFFSPDQLERSHYRVVGYMQADNFVDILRQIFPKPLF